MMIRSRITPPPVPVTTPNSAQMIAGIPAFAASAVPEIVKNPSPSASMMSARATNVVLHW